MVNWSAALGIIFRTCTQLKAFSMSFTHDLPPSRTPTAIQALSGHLDFSNCDREQVQYPGTIMPHGVMLILASDDYRVLAASTNAGAWFKEDSENLLGGHLAQIVPTDVRQILEEGLAHLAEPSPSRYLGCFRTFHSEVQFDVFAHRSGEHFVLEFESLPAGAVQSSPIENFANIGECIKLLQTADTWREGMKIATRELKRLGCFDSVIGVRFMPDGSGHAVAEAREAHFPTFFDMRFPRSDIPDPGRRQMLLMPVQYAPEHDYEPVPLVVADAELNSSQIDLGFSVLRSMSRMCSRYYLNMGSHSRLLLTLVDQGKLWGFLSCMNATPRQVPYADRLAYQSFAEMAALLLVEKEKAEQNLNALRAKRRITEAAAELSSVEGFPVALHGLPAHLLGLMDLAGAALCLDKRITCAGVTPPEATIKALTVWLECQDSLFVTNQLPTLFELSADYKDRATGLIAARLMEPGQYLVGFRPEWVYEVRWAGDPRKPVDLDTESGEPRLTPRGSFEVWKETVRGTARPWQSYETEAMADLQRALILAQYAEKRRVLRSLLERSNAELEAFAFIVSHDLQEPLRGIRNFSAFLRDRTGGRLEEHELTWIDTIMKLGGRMSDQIQALLQYSRAGQTTPEVRPVDINGLLGSVVEDLSVRIAETGARIEIKGPLPILMCDPIRTAAVFENLITNAIKYNDSTEKRVEIGCLGGPEHTLYVRDNGIGITERHQEAIFTIFRRLHGRDEYGGGTGAGLTITRKHIEQQGGRLWLESTPGQGTTFFFTLDP